MNIADKMERESRLRGNLAEWIMSHGIVKSDRERSNEYVGVRIAEVRWWGAGLLHHVGGRESLPD